LQNVVELFIVQILRRGKYGKYKWPKLMELHTKLFSVGFEEAHDAIADIRATAKCFFELQRLGIIP